MIAQAVALAPAPAPASAKAPALARARAQARAGAASAYGVEESIAASQTAALQQWPLVPKATSSMGVHPGGSGESDPPMHSTIRPTPQPFGYGPSTEHGGPPSPAAQLQIPSGPPSGPPSGDHDQHEVGAAASSAGAASTGDPVGSLLLEQAANALGMTATAASEATRIEARGMAVHRRQHSALRRPARAMSHRVPTRIGTSHARRHSKTPFDRKRPLFR